MSTRPGAHSPVRKFEMPGEDGRADGACVYAHTMSAYMYCAGREWLAFQISAPIRRPEGPTSVIVI